jgi:hypothetical protein
MRAHLILHAANRQRTEELYRGNSTTLRLVNTGHPLMWQPTESATPVYWSHQHDHNGPRRVRYVQCHNDPRLMSSPPPPSLYLNHKPHPRNQHTAGQLTAPVWVLRGRQGARSLPTVGKTRYTGEWRVPGCWCGDCGDRDLSRFPNGRSHRVPRSRVSRFSLWGAARLPETCRCRALWRARAGRAG